jgi:hypothetical protein
MAAWENLAGLIADAEERERTDGKLSDALARRTGTATLALPLALTSHEATHCFLQAGPNAAPEAYVPDTMMPGEDRGIGLMIEAVGIVGTMFVCPECDHDDMRETLADGTSACPRHGSGYDAEERLSSVMLRVFWPGFGSQLAKQWSARVLSVRIARHCRLRPVQVPAIRRPVPFPVPVAVARAAHRRSSADQPAVAGSAAASPPRCLRFLLLLHRKARHHE